MTLVLITGVSGSGSNLRAANAAQIVGNAEHFQLGERMLERAPTLGRSVGTERILDLSPDALRFLRALALDEIISEAREQLANGHVVISLHTTFRWNHYVEPSLDTGYVKKLVALGKELDHDVIFVNVVRTAPDNWIALEQSDQWAGRMTFDEFLLWREEEGLVTRILAEYSEVPFFQIGFDQDEDEDESSDVLARLLADPKAPKAYFSFPITHIKTDPEKLEAARDFGLRLKEPLIVFDPLSVRDKAWLSGSGDDYPDCPLAPDDVSEAARAFIDNQTVSRDFQLIEQSDLVAVWYNTNLLSVGVWAEILRAFTTGKDVFIYHPFSPSPFLTYFVSQQFQTENDLLAAVSKYKR